MLHLGDVEVTGITNFLLGKFTYCIGKTTSAADNLVTILSHKLYKKKHKYGDEMQCLVSGNQIFN